MSSLAAVELAARLASAPDGRPLGDAVVQALVDDWGADAAVAWLPSGDPDSVLAADVSAAGPALGQPGSGLLAAIRERQIAHWLAEQQLPHAHWTDLPASARGVIAAAWRDDSAAPAGTAQFLDVLASHVALLRDRERLKTELAEAVTARAGADEQIVRTRRVRAMGEMASGIVHDFNNALTSILGYAELALGPLKEGDAFHNDLSSIRTAALDAAALVRRLQSLGRHGREHDEREIADLREVARLMPSLARPRWTQRSQCEGVHFDIVVDDTLAPLVNVVVAEIRELLLNLLFNAIDAMPDGGRITISTGSAADGWAVIRVADEGTGMTDDVKARLFEPFFSTKGDKGSGLGLSVCRTIAARHGGRLDVESAPGCGSVFTLGLPPAPASAIAAGAIGHACPPPSPVGPRRILLVDDQAEVRESVGEMLRAMGHTVAVAESGLVALQLASRQRFDVLFTDLGMPEMNGFALAQRFCVVAPGMPVVLLTGWGLDATAECPPNITFVMGKPVTLRHLSDALASCAPDLPGGRSARCS